MIQQQVRIIYTLSYIPYIIIFTLENVKRNTIVKDVAIWVPTNSIMISDALFPHISHGFRNRTLPVVTYHVNNYLFFIKGLPFIIYNS